MKEVAQQKLYFIKSLKLLVLVQLFYNNRLQTNICYHFWKLHCVPSFFKGKWFYHLHFFQLVTQFFPHHFDIHYLINKCSQGYQEPIRSLYSSVVEHWSCKPGVVSSNLTGGNHFFIFLTMRKKLGNCIWKKNANDKIISL